jgi:hypothetical protein
MNLKNKIIQNVMFVLAFVIALSSCQKIVHPALPADYPKDANPPGGPLKFYAALDGTSVDSIRANFGAENNVTWIDGISGKAYQGSPTSYISYGKPNDFANSTSFTIAFWVKKTPQAAGSGTNFAFSLNAKGYSWTNTKLFLEFEDAGNPSTTAMAAAKFYVDDQWVEYTKHTASDDRMPNVLDGSWHHLAFTYDETNSNLVSYIDGVLFKTNTIGTLGAADFSNFTDFTIGGPNQYTHDQNTWMGFFDGAIDQFRLYSTVLSPADIAALYANKE